MSIETRRKAGRSHTGLAGTVRILIGLLIVLTIVTGPLGCQAGRARRSRLRAMKITDTSGYAELVARRRKHEQTTKTDGTDTSSEETIFEESVNLEADGYAIHPNFLEFTVGGLLGLRQYAFEDVTDDDVRSLRDDGSIEEFLFEGTMFRKKKYPLSVYASRERSLVPRLFQESIDTVSTNYEVIWQYLHEKAPTRLQFSHNDISFDPAAGTTTTERGDHQTTSFRLETGYIFNPSNTLTLRYERRKVREQPFEFNYDLDDATLSHVLEFGEGNRHRLDSDLYWTDQTGTFSLERFRWRERLRLEHSRTLRTEYQFEAIDRTQGNISATTPIEDRSYHVSALIEHRLYESLISQFTTSFQRQELNEDSRIDRVRAGATFDYRKRNRWGMLLADYQIDFQRQENRVQDQDVRVLQEPHTFNDPNPVTLVNRNIDLGSIVVTDENRLTLFQPGRDYTVERVGDRVELHRVTTGAITDGQLVLVDYTYHLGGTFELDTLTQNFRIEQKFKWGLSTYYRLRNQDQTLWPEEASGAVPEDITSHLFGVEWEHRKLRLAAEYEDYQSTLNSYEAIRLFADYSRRFKRGSIGSVGARWTNIDYSFPDPRRTRLLTLEGRYRHPITRRLTVEGTVIYRTEEDTLSGPEDGIDIDLSLEWFIRKTEIRITYELNQFEDNFARNDSSALYVQVRRNF